MGSSCWRHEYDGPEDRCPECWKEGPDELNPHDYDDGTFNRSELILIRKINELAEYIRELRKLTEVSKQ